MHAWECVSVCHCESVCIHKHLLALPGLVLNVTPAEFDLSTFSKATNRQKIMKIVTEINFLISPFIPFLCSLRFSAWPFSLWPKTELVDLLHYETSLLILYPIIISIMK